MHRTNELFVERLPLAPGRRWIGYALALVFVLIGLGMRLSLGRLLPPGLPYVTVFPAVLLSCFLFGIGPGLLAAAAGGFFAYFWFTAPTFGGIGSVNGALALFFYAAAAGVNIIPIHWLQRSNRKLARQRERNRELADTRKVLFHELQHRVSNNLQLASALLTLQRRTVADEQAVRVLDEASRRLMLIGRISRSLYDSETGRHRLEPFLRDLVCDILHASGREDIQLSLDIGCDPDLPSGASVPMALVIAESVSNAVEHGLADRQDARIDIRVAPGEDGGMTIEIADNGRGLPPGFQAEKSDSLGLRIASALAAQLKGGYRLLPRPEGGTVAQLRLSL